MHLAPRYLLTVNLQPVDDANTQWNEMNNY